MAINYEHDRNDPYHIQFTSTFPSVTPVASSTNINELFARMIRTYTDGPNDYSHLIWRGLQRAYEGRPITSQELSNLINLATADITLQNNSRRFQLHSNHSSEDTVDNFGAVRMPSNIRTALPRVASLNAFHHHNNSLVITLENTNPTANGPNSQPPAGFFEGANANADTGRNLIETCGVLKFLLKYFPFCLILFSKAIYDHLEGVLKLIIVCATFVHANSVVKREASAQVKRSKCNLSLTLIYILTCFAFITYAFDDEKMHLNVVFIPTYKQRSTVWDLLLATGLIDFILKLITIKFKIILTMLPVWFISFQKRGQVYLFIEAVSQLYRSLATIQPWLFHLLGSYHTNEKLVGVFLSAAYILYKGSNLMSRWKLFKTAFLKLVYNTTLGPPPTKNELQTAGNYCTICHDVYVSPVLLQCHHIFCDSCVGTWFDKVQTCPLCRARIINDLTWRDGSTTFSMQLF